MRERIANVNAAFDRAEQTWSGAGVRVASWLGVTPRDQVMGALRQMRASWERLAKVGESLPATDQARLTAWVKDANGIIALLRETAEDAGIASLGTIVADTAAATTRTVGRGAGAAAQAVASAGYVVPLVLGLLLLVLLVWKLA